MAGTCFTTGACGVGEGGMDHNSRTPYAEQASFELDRQFGRGFALNLSYLFVEAHKLVRGNNLNVPCPVGTTKSGTPTDPLPEWVPGWLNADGTFRPVPVLQRWPRRACGAGTLLWGRSRILGFANA